MQFAWPAWESFTSLVTIIQYGFVAVA